MDYEKKYKEALSKAKELSDSNPSDEGVQKWIQDTFPELRESKDERMKKSLKRIIASFHDCNFPTPEGFTRKELFDWLEKQGEKKPADYENPNIQQNDFAPKSAMEAIKEEKVDNANKAEPKFKVKDWIVDKSGLAQQVLDFRGGIYTCTYHSFTTDCESNYHLWTIQDVKEGDILANCNIICIYKKRESEHLIKVYLNYSIREGIEITDDTIGDFNLYPATKEEREFLFQKVKEAGWSWNDKTKELTISENNTKVEMINLLQSALDKADFDYDTHKKLDDFLKSL